MKEKTDEQLEKIKKRAIKFFKKRYKYTPDFTCDDCDARSRCQYVYDFYNTDGDCLAMK